MRAINDLLRHSHALRGELLGALTAVVDRGHFILGEEVRQFEQEFASYCGRQHCVSVANGTDALELSLRALGIGAGDVVLCAANAGLYSTCAIRLVGGVPGYVDAEALSGLMCLNALERSCSAFHPRAIIITHLYGRMVDMPRVMQIASQFSMAVIEDCAQAHGARLDGRRAGSWGDMGCFSFYPTKNLGALGDAGAVITGTDELASGIRQLRQYGWSQKYCAALPNGRNSRMDELQAAVLRRCLPKLDAWNERRREIADTYVRLITHQGVTSLAGSGPSYVGHLYVVKSRARDSLKAHLAGKGIACDIHYPIPDHLQASNQLEWKSLGLPISEALSAEILTLPCYPELTDEEVHQIAGGVNSWRP
jgi:aminotransferase EvaB